ncbi:MAG: hypothetical protein JRF42_05280, partial [Deltaproteobacteria bacterium]|nr:hypothetical protein [Deltaproteobacteria bacterium]
MQAVRRAVRPADQVRAILAQQLASPTVERHRKMAAQVAVGHDVTALVPEQQRQDRKTIGVEPEPRRAHGSVTQ